MIGITKLSKNSEHNEICKNVYEESFPSYERWPFETMLERERDRNFDVYAIVDDNKAIGIYVPWTFEDFIYIEFVAIDKSFRGKNYGSLFLKYILEKSNKNIVIEVEPSQTSDFAKKRIEWYERFGFIMCNEKYFMPALDKLPVLKNVEMKIMTTNPLTKDDFEKIKNILHKHVYEMN